jgi:glycosyltransferase involved in cell wall biosynthesis
VHQVLPIVEPGAVTGHALAVRDALRAAGHDSEVFAPLFHPAAEAWGRPLDAYRRHARPGDRLVYHLAIGSTAADFVLARSETLVVNHHNITPPRYFAGWEPVAAHGVGWGRSQLRELARRAALGIGDSRFNESELVEAGYARTTTVPILFDGASFAVEADSAALARLTEARAGAQWLFVGRMVPNKAQHDVVKAFAAYRRFHDPGAQLHLVGGGHDGAYGHAVACFADALGVRDAVTITGPVPHEVLAAHYEAADVLVVLSEHEGFCVPLLEAMHHRVPIVAYDAAAVPETLGDAGILLPRKDAATVAAAVDRVLRDDALRARLVAAGTQRLADFDLTRTAPAFVAAVESV